MPLNGYKAVASILLILLAVPSGLIGCGLDGRGPVAGAADSAGDANTTDQASRATADSSNPPSAEVSQQPGSSARVASGVLAVSRDWPLMRGNAQATGVAQSGLPVKLDLLWSFSGDDDTFETTVAIADGTVYAGSLGGNLYAVDLATGREKWRFFSKLGFTAAPAVRGGLVYAGDADGRFYCLDAANGKPKWHYDAQAEINACANFHDARVLFGSQDGSLYCLAADSGQLVWKYESGDQIRSFPTIAEGHAFVAGCDGRLHVVDLDSGKAVRFIELDGPTGCTAAVLGTKAFVGSEGGTFFGIDWRQGEVVWTYQNPRRGTSFRSSAAATPDQVVVGARDKLLRAFDPASGKELWSFTTQGQVDSSPVVAGNRVVFGSGDGRIYALEARTGQETWRFEAGGNVVASPAVAAGRLVIGTDGGDLYCFGEKQK